MRQCTVKPAWISHALKRRPYWEEQTRLIPSVFYMLSFHPFLKQKNVKRTLLQTDNISSPLIKKQPAWRGHKDFRNSRETENYLGHFCQISQKEAFFLHFKRTFFFFWFQFAVLKECNTFHSNSLSFTISCSLQPTNNCFCATESDIDLQTILHPSMNYWFQYCDLH